MSCIWEAGCHGRKRERAVEDWKKVSENLLPPAVCVMANVQSQSWRCPFSCTGDIQLKNLHGLVILVGTCNKLSSHGSQALRVASSADATVFTKVR